MNGTSKPRPLKVTTESYFFATSQNCASSSVSSAQGMNFTSAFSSSTSSKSSATNKVWPRCVSALSMAMQTTCDVNGHRLMNLAISSRLGVLAVASASLSAKTAKREEI